VVGPAAFQSRRRLWKALESAYPVTFCARAPGEHAELAGLIAVGDLTAAPPASLPALQTIADEPVRDDPQPVQLACAPCLDSRLHDQRLVEDRCPDPMGAPRDGDIVLASTPAGPLWTAARDEPWAHTSALLASELGPQEVLRDRFRATRFLGLLPILELLRFILAGRASTMPELRAAFILDDPNLHWPSYGFADFAALDRAARAHRFHVAIATVPLDAWFSHPAAVRLFAHGRTLSLLVHGNDHIRCELGRDLPAQDRTRLAAQAQRRIAALERRTGLHVARVMAPPHGQCSHGMLATLRTTGFDAACISRPFPYLDRPPADALDAQWPIADVADGCIPVIPRYGLDRPAQDIILRAYLGQPLVLYGHHGDLRDGLDTLIEHANTINALGDVRWMGLGEIAASNFTTQTHDGVQRIRLFTRHATVTPADDVKRMVVHYGSRAGEGPCESLEVRLRGSASLRISLDEEFELGDGDAELELRLIGADATDTDGVAAPSWKAWPRARRALVECRDRSGPILTKVRRGPAGPRS
jgi:hypothetical protein